MSALADIAGPGDGGIFERIAHAIERDGYVIVPDALPANLLDSLLLQVTGMDDEDLSGAGIGRDRDHQLNRFVRTDRIFWLEKGTSPGSDGYLVWMEELRLALNRRLFLGLFDFEAHFARYEIGDYYKRHLDAFQGRTNRVLSTVLYLNPGWQPGQGGELLIYQEPESDLLLQKVAPLSGTLVVFLSERFPHEVLPALKRRHSIAGWYRVNNSLGGVIDPPF